MTPTVKPVDTCNGARDKVLMGKYRGVGSGGTEGWISGQMAE